MYFGAPREEEPRSTRNALRGESEADRVQRERRTERGVNGHDCALRLTDIHPFSTDTVRPPRSFRQASLENRSQRQPAGWHAHEAAAGEETRKRTASCAQHGLTWADCWRIPILMSDPGACELIQRGERGRVREGRVCSPTPARQLAAERGQRERGSCCRGRTGC